MKSFNIIIETPKGSPQKYKLDKKSGYFLLKKILPAGMMFPFDFGFIPGTKGDDKDPLDAFVISEFKSFPGCLIKCRLIGAILAEQSDKKETVRNDRYFFIPELSKQFSNVKTIRDMESREREEIEIFFTQYNKVEGKEFKIIKMVDPPKAYKLISEYRE
jgi:inorganic pyrophosphatase